MRHRQTLAPQNPTLKQEEDFLNTLKLYMEERRRELSKNFDSMVSEEIGKKNNEKPSDANAGLGQVGAHGEQPQETPARENTQTLEIGKRQLAIQEVEEQMRLTMQTYNKVRARIQELTMERKRPARISIAYDAEHWLCAGG